MSPRTARRLLCLAGILLLPLPYLLITEGSVPVVRFAFLTAITTAYAALVDGSGVAWVVAGILAAHAVGGAVVVAAASAVTARVLPDRVRGPVVLAAVVSGAAVALAGRPYHVPFDDAVAWTNWIGLFR